MKRAATIVVAWTARLAAWAVLLGLGTHFVSNYQGITVRAQLARIRVGSEEEDAVRALFERAGLLHLLPRVQATWGDPSGRYDPLFILARQPTVLYLEVEALDGMDFERIAIAFDGDGRVVGAPIVLEDAPGRYFAAPLQIITADSAHFLIFEDYFDTVTTPTTTALADYDSALRVYRLVNARSAEVFTIACNCPSAWQVTLEAKHRDDGAIALDLKGTLARGQNPQTMATFVWNEALGRFVGPQHDPQGRWEVIFPPPDPTEPTQ